MSGFFSEKNKLIFLFILAAVFGLTLSFIFSQKIDPTALFIDSMAYKATALNIVEHGDFSDPDQTIPNNFRAPFYPLWLALIYLIFGSFKFAVPIGILFFSLSAPLTYLIAKELFNEKVALLSGLLIAFEPWAAFLTGTIMSEQLFLPIFLLSAYFLIRYLKYDLRYHFYFSALFFGAAILTRPYILYFWPILAIIIFFKNQKFWQSLKITALATLIFLFTIAPWAIRNKIVLNTWQFSSVPGFSLYVVNFNTLQVYLGNFKSLDDGYARAYKITEGFSIVSAQGSAILMKEAMSGIKNNLFDYAKISIISLPNFFISNSYSSLGYYLGLKEFKIQSQVFGFIKARHFSQARDKILNISWSERILLISGFFWPIISALFLTGAVVSLLKFRQANLVGIIYIFATIFYFDAITHLMPELARFRIMAQPFIFIFASLSLVYLFEKIKFIMRRTISNYKIQAFF